MSVYQIKNNTEEMKIVSVNGKDELIPESWKINNLKKICFYNKNKFRKVNEDIIYIDISVVKDYKIQNGKYIENNNIPSRANTVLHGDEILLSMVRPNLKTIAFSGEKEKNKIASSGLAVLSYKYVDIKFVYFMFKCDKFVILFSKIANGGNYPSLSKANLNAVEVIFPENNDEQKKIADHLSFIENTIFKTEKLISEKEKELRYYSRELLSGKLRVKKDVNGNIEFYDNAHWKTVLVNKKEVNIPEDWSVQKINNVTTKNEKSTIKAGDLTLHGDYPAFNCSKFLTKKYENYIIDGENLFLSTGGMSSIHYYKGKCAYSTDVFSLSSQNFNMQYLYFILNNKEKDIDKMFYGSGLKHLNKNDLMDYDFIFTNIQEEQDLITSLLQDGAKEIEEYNKLLDSLKSRLKGDMQKLLTGECVLGSQIV